jgi:hypothetical protein
MTARFSIVRRLPCTPAQFWTLIHASREFGEAVHRDHLGFGYEVLEDEPSSGKWKTKVVPKIAIPEVLKRAGGADADGFYYFEEGVRDTANNRYRFSIAPSLFTDKVSVKGELTLVPVGTDACERTIKLEIDVRAFGIGGIIETFVERALRQSYDGSADFTDKWLDAKLGRA